jgi:hypothetical protein
MEALFLEVLIQTLDDEIRSHEVRENKLHQQVTPIPDSQSLNASLLK